MRLQSYVQLLPVRVDYLPTLEDSVQTLQNVGLNDEIKCDYYQQSQLLVYYMSYAAY